MRFYRPAILAATATLLLAGIGGEAEAQVRRSSRDTPATTARPAAPAGNQVRVGNTQIQGGNRVGGNVNIGNDITIGRSRGPAVVAVPVYPGYDSGPSVGAMLATGVVAGVTAGLVVGAMQDSSTPTAATTSAPATTTVLEVGTRLSALPSGCVTQQVSGKAYYRCGSSWLQSAMDGAQLVYVVVRAPA